MKNNLPFKESEKQWVLLELLVSHLISSVGTIRFELVAWKYPTSQYNKANFPVKNIKSLSTLDAVRLLTFWKKFKIRPLWRLIFKKEKIAIPF